LDDHVDNRDKHEGGQDYEANQFQLNKTEVVEVLQVEPTG
jgi:hypothetical protein